MVLTPHLPRSSSQPNVAAMHYMRAPTPARSSRTQPSHFFAQDELHRPLPRATLATSRSAPQLAVLAARRVEAHSFVSDVTFVSEAELTKRFSDKALWPPLVNEKILAVVWRYCWMLMRKETNKTYDPSQAAHAIVNALRPMWQMSNSERLAALEQFGANVFVEDTSARAAVVDELRKIWAKR